MGRSPPEALGAAPTHCYAAAVCTRPAEVTQVSARTCVQPGAPAPCPPGHCGSGAGLRSYLPPELNGDSLSPPLLVRRPLSPLPSPAPSTRAASRPGCGGCAAPRPARPRRLSQAILKVSRAPAPSFTLRLPGAVFPEPARPRQRQPRCAGRAVQGSAGQCGAVRGLRRHRFESGLGRCAPCGCGSVARAPPRAPGELCLFSSCLRETFASS